MDSATRTNEPAVEALRERVERLSAGEYEVEDVLVERGRDSQGNEAIFLTVVLQDPSEDTWPVDDVLELHREIDQLAIELHLAVRWYVQTQGATPQLFDPEDLVPGSPG